MGRILQYGIVLSVFMVYFLFSGYGQGTETFQNICTVSCNPSSSSYGSRSWTGDDGSTWTATNSRTDQTIDGEAMTMNDDNANTYILSGLLSGGVGDLTITTQRKYSGNSGFVNVLINGNNVGTVPYSDIVQTTTLSGINVSGDFVIRINNDIGGSNGGGDDRVAIDNVSWIGYSIGSSPQILIDVTQLSGFSYINGSGPSQEQSFTVEGINLTDNIIIVAPVDYEISEDSGTGFGNSITLTNSGGAIGSTDIYVRLVAGLNPGTYNNEIIQISSTGAAIQLLECNGTVFNTEPTNHPSDFSASTNSYNKITLAWADSDAVAYLIKGSNVDYPSIIAPVDGVAETNDLLKQNVVAGTETFQFTGLTPETSYYFKIFPYNGSDATINYKTDGTVQQDDATTSVAPTSPNVFFSEYIEGSSNNKAIEIYNGTGASIDLSDYTVKLGSNGGDWGNTEVLSGTLAAGEVYVIFNSEAGPEIQAEGDIPSSVTFYNGDDALGLFYSSILIDVIGEQGNDPGSAWDVAGVSGATAEHTLIRKTSVTSGNTDWASSAGTDVSNSEWIIQGQDYFGNLGFGGTVWTGGTDSEWATNGNWDADAPASSGNAQIPDVSSAKAHYPVISGSVIVENLAMSSGSTLDIASTGDLTVNGTFINNGSLNVLSDALGNGSLIEHSGVTANIQQYLAADKWHYISSPVTSTTSNVFTGLYLKEWDEPTETWNYITGTGVSLNTSMQGYATWATSTASTVTFAGNLNTGSKFIGVTNNNIDPLNGSSGFNFAGNPYPSAIDWDVNDGEGWTRSNVSYSIYIWNQDVGNYGVYVKGTGGNGSNGVSNVIAPHQGFFVYCDDNAGPGAGSGTLGVNDGARIHSNQQILKGTDAVADYIKIKVTGNNYSDEALIIISPEAGFDFDAQYDGLKFSGAHDAPQLCTYTSEGVKLSVNSIPSVANNLTIGMGLQVGAKGFYELSMPEINGFEGLPVWLEDLKDNKIISLNPQVPYKFFAGPADNDNRFVLHFSNGETPSPFIENNNDLIAVYQSKGKIIVASAQEITGIVKVFDFLGREILSQTMAGVTLLKINQIKERGYYVVSINTTAGIFNHKLLIK